MTRPADLADKEMERALDQILLGVNDLLSKAPPQARAPAARTSAIEFSEQESQSLVLALAYLESQTGHPAQAMARRALLRVLEARTVPLGNLSAEFSQVTVSAAMARALQRLHQAGARLFTCKGSHTYWDCGFLAPAAVRGLLGRFGILDCLDQSMGKTLHRLPRIAQRCAVRLLSPSERSAYGGLEGCSEVAVCDQDNSHGHMATVFLLEQGPQTPGFFAGYAMLEGRLVILMDSSSR